jgi:hypothetical protein
MIIIRRSEVRKKNAGNRKDVHLLIVYQEICLHVGNRQEQISQLCFPFKTIRGLRNPAPIVFFSFPKIICRLRKKKKKAIRSMCFLCLSEM